MTFFCDTIDQMAVFTIRCSIERPIQAAILDTQVFLWVQRQWLVLWNHVMNVNPKDQQVTDKQNALFFHHWSWFCLAMIYCTLCDNERLEKNFRQWDTKLRFTLGSLHTDGVETASDPLGQGVCLML